MFSCMKSLSFKKKKIDKPDEFCDTSPFSSLPDDIIALQILSKVNDLKTLCVCKLVSLRFNRIVHQVDTLSVTGLSIDNPSFGLSDIVFKPLQLMRSMCMSKPPVSPSPLSPSLSPLPAGVAGLDVPKFYQWESFSPVMKSLMSFTRLKFLHMELPPFFEDADDRFLFKWKINTDVRLESFVFLSPSSIYDTKGLSNNENIHDDDGWDFELFAKNCRILQDCMVDGILRRWMLSCLIPYYPLLENATITDMNNRGRISLSGAKLTELSMWLKTPKNIRETLIRENDCRISYCYVPLMELPVSGYVMKGVTLFLCMSHHLPEAENESPINFDFEDNEEAAYSEAVTEIFKNHRGRIQRWG